MSDAPTTTTGTGDTSGGTATPSTAAPSTGQTDPTSTSSGAATTASETGTATTTAATAQPDPAAGKTNPWDNPDSAKAEIERLRRENGAARTNAKAQAAEDARKELANTIGKALGIIEDGAETDPAKLTESLTASQAEAKRARVELAVFRNAATAGADPAALLDSASFLAKVANLDPTDTAALTAAIEDAVEANPRLGAASAEPTVRAPAPNPAQGASSTGAAGGTPQLTEADVKKLSEEGRHEEIVKAKAEGRLNDYLGIK
ncbi:hypothetical protein [Nocardioides sp. BYT-33-1]|uniref:hypothetical protein n=1 Tax=Nocardioides sp. BYT-33-1 TaxID=3416952 RepID=UPI003F53B9CD